MDGAFVPNITMGPPIIKRLRKACGLFFDVHLMIEKPERYLEEFVDAGADLVCVHAEASIHLERTVSAIRGLGVKCGVALNPHTPLNVLEYLLPQAGHGAHHEREPRFRRPKLHPLQPGQDPDPGGHGP